MSCLQPDTVISLDTEKAFDGVVREYLFAGSHEFSFREKLISWIQHLYPSPLASIHTNDVCSEYAVFP